MFVIYNDKTKFPIKTWLSGMDKLEESCLEQAYHLSNLPFLHKWVCLMPDTHTGMGMPIGGVIAAKDVVIPNAVGVDIGCGMVFTATDIKYKEISEATAGTATLMQSMIGGIMRSVPVGFESHKKKQDSPVLDEALQNSGKYEANPELMHLLEEGYFQTGTLGGGNHFIELQEDEEGYLCIMIHSGSRHLGKEICDYFHKKARTLNKTWYSQVPEEYRLAFLPTGTEEGAQYLNWMQLALAYAFENRERMLERVCGVVKEQIERYAGVSIAFTDKINCHHNYAALENHYGENVWVHRKGATRVRKGERAVIPGAMGSYSYVVEGKGNEESFCTDRKSVV